MPLGSLGIELPRAGEVRAPSAFLNRLQFLKSISPAVRRYRSAPLPSSAMSLRSRREGD